MAAKSAVPLFLSERRRAALRGVDSQGSGAFGASRGARKHRGVDFVAKPGVQLLSPVNGFVSKYGFPYHDINKRKFRYVAIVDDAGDEHRFMYVSLPRGLTIGQRVEVGDLIGNVQNIAKLYDGMKNHVHYEIVRRSADKRIYVDPEKFWQ